MTPSLKKLIENPPPVECFDRYLLVVHRLHTRYSQIYKRETGRPGILIDISGKPSLYKTLEDAAWNKYVVNHESGATK